MLQLCGTANHVNFRIIECGLQAIESCADKAKRQNWVCKLHDVLNGNFCFANFADRQMQKFLNYFNLVWSVKWNNSQFKFLGAKSIEFRQMTFLCFGLTLIKCSSKKLVGLEGFSFMIDDVLSEFAPWLIYSPIRVAQTSQGQVNVLKKNVPHCKSLFVNLPTSQEHAWFISFDQRKNRLLWSQSYDFTSARKPAMNFNHRHRKKGSLQPEHFSADINGSIFQSQTSNLFPRCRFLKLFKIHSNFSPFCTVFSFVSLSSAWRTIFTCQRWKNVVFPFSQLWFFRSAIKFA